MFGLDEQVTGRKAPAAINAGYDRNLFWDGRATDEFRDPVSGAVLIAEGAALESQILRPPLSDAEMAHSGRDWQDVVERLATVTPLALSPQLPEALQAWIGDRRYPALFEEVYGSAHITAARIAVTTIHKTGDFHCRRRYD